MSAEPLPLTLPTQVNVRVIARDGKFLGDDIGGAHITVRDALTREMLAEGVTSGGSGPNGTTSDPDAGVMCARQYRGQAIPQDGASLFQATLQLAGPRRIEVTAFGPLGARGSANTVSATQWVYPGRDITGGNGFLLELPGLIVQIISPLTHYTPATLPSLTIQANVAMMCGCPISWKKAAGTQICPGRKSGDPQPWEPAEFQVEASIQASTGSAPTVLPLLIDTEAGTAGQFTAVWNGPLPGIYLVTVYAYQASNGNTGVDFATVIVPKPTVAG
jgi:hypothetical protein